MESEIFHKSEIAFRIFIYKNKEVAINFETPHFSDLYKLMDADGGRQEALVTGQYNSS